MEKMIKMLSSGFHKCLAPINMLTVEEGPEMALSREFFNQVFDIL